MWSVWWFCSFHGRWELDAEGMSWEEACEHARKIIELTGQPALAVSEGEE